MEVDNFSDLLEMAGAGDPEPLISSVYGELRRIAGGIMRGRLNGHTLQPTALVNEAYLRLLQGETRWDNQAHFFGSAARAMRQVLVAYARERSAQKRAGGSMRVTFRDLDVEAPEPHLDVVLLDEAITALGRLDKRFVRILELRYFAGCTLPEIAEKTGACLSTVKRDCTFARAWLHDYMKV
jgi:RNA polymerase sigma factor (TIGR02999 family)